MEMYRDYLREREGADLIWNEKGWAAFRVIGPECYISEIYVKPEFRRQSVASKLADEITEMAKEVGCTHLTGTVCPQAEGADDSLKALQGYGMRLYSSSEEKIVFIKEINHG